MLTIRTFLRFGAYLLIAHLAELGFFGAHLNSPDNGEPMVRALDRRHQALVVFFGCISLWLGCDQA